MKKLLIKKKTVHTWMNIKLLYMSPVFPIERDGHLRWNTLVNFALSITYFFAKNQSSIGGQNQDASLS